MAEDTPEEAVVRYSFGALLFFGIVGVITGILAMVWPDITVLALVWLVGISLLFFGISEIFGAFTMSTSGWGRALLILAGVLGLVAGGLVIAEPLRGAATLVLVIGAFWIADGAIETITSIMHRTEVWGWQLFSGLLSVVAGIVVLGWPGITLLALAIWTGAWLVVTGIIRIILAFKLRRAGSAIGEAAATA